MPALAIALALKGAVVLAAAALAALLLRRVSAAARHGVWVAAFGALLALPALAVFGPAWEVPLLPAPESGPLAMAPPAVPLMETPPADASLTTASLEAKPLALEAPASPAASPAAAPPPASPLASPLPLAPEAAFHPAAPLTDAIPLSPEASAWPAPLSFLRLLVGLWAAGAALVLLGWAAALGAAHLLVRRARPESDPGWLDVLERARRLSGVEGPVRLLRSDALDVPVAWGLGRAAVVLPPGADAWDEDRREAVLLHELAHIRRRDARTQLVAQAAVALHWFDPLAWWGYRRFLDERERACDDAVLRVGAVPSAYATHLVDIARSIRRERMALAGLSPMARCSGLETRIRSILGDRTRASLSRPSALLTAAAALALLLPLAACQVTGRAADEPKVYAASQPMDEVHVEAERVAADAERLAADAARVAERAAAITEAKAAAALGRATAQASGASTLARLRPEAALSEEEMAKVETDLAEALGEAPLDWDDALAEVRAELEGIDMAAIQKKALEDVLASLAEADRERAEALREAKREQERALREAERERARVIRETQREIEQAQRQRREAQRQRQEAQRQRRDDVAPVPTPSPAPRFTPSPPRTPSSGYSYGFSLSTDGAAFLASADAALADTLRAVNVSLSHLASGAASASGGEARADLHRALDGLERGIGGLERAARAWTHSDQERRAVAQHIARLRVALADARGSKPDACD